jgi:class 3 adenylate cyclase
MQPVTRYVESNGAHIAWQVVGDGPVDLVVIPGFASHLDLQWGDRGFIRMMRRLTSFSRVVLFDKPGTGLSDAVASPRSLEALAEDVLAVMDAAEAEQPVLFGASAGGPLSMLLAAAHPERVRALVMYAVFVKGMADDRHPWAVTEHQWAQIEAVIDHWGEGSMIDLVAPSLAGSSVQRRLFAAFERASCSPGSVRAIAANARQLDVTGVLPSVRVPTLVLARDREFLGVEHARYIAGAIPGARYVEMAGVDHAITVGDVDALIDPIEEFVTGTKSESDSERTLTTLLSVDVVGSTAIAAELGDHRWRQVLQSYADAAGDAVVDHGGQTVTTAGDGLLASFDGPRAALEAAWKIQAVGAQNALTVRAGVHTGMVELIGDDVAGLEVHVAARIGALAGAGEVLVSDTARGMVGAGGVGFDDAGHHELRGVPGQHQLWRARPADPLEVGDPQSLRRRDRALVWLAGRTKRVSAARMTTG